MALTPDQSTNRNQIIEYSEPSSIAPYRDHLKPAKEYDGRLAALIVNRVTGGEAPPMVLREYGMTPSDLRRWEKRSEEFSAAMKSAQRVRARLLMEETVAIADEPVEDMAQVANKKLRIDSRQTLAKKLNPQEFGDKAEEVESTDWGKVLDEARRLRTTPGPDTPVSTPPITDQAVAPPERHRE